jgi:hypothetical protein
MSVPIIVNSRLTTAVVVLEVNLKYKNACQRFLCSQIENRMLQEQVERYNDRIRDYQGKPRAYRNQERGVNDSNLDVKRRLNY